MPTLIKNKFNTDAGLVEMVNAIAQEFFYNNELIDSFQLPTKEIICTVKYNKRLQTTGGRLVRPAHTKDKPTQWILDFNPKLLSNEEQGLDALVGTIKHELAHYYLALAGLDAGHATWRFKMLVNDTNGLFYAPSWLNCHYYKCLHCGVVTESPRKLIKRHGVFGYTHNCQDGTHGKLKEVDGYDA